MGSTLYIPRAEYPTSPNATVVVSKMAKILFLAHRIPYPPNKGDKLRAYQVLCHWAQRHDVFLGCFIDNPDDLQHRDLLSELCVGTYFVRLHPKLALVRSSAALLTGDPLSVLYYRDRGLTAWVRRVLSAEKPDCAFAFSSVMGQYFLDTASPPLRLLVDFVDVDSEKWREYAARKTFPARQIYRREARKLLEFDRRVAAKADASIFVSEAEAELFRKRGPELSEKIVAIPNGVDTAYFSPRNAGQNLNFGGKPVIVFTGQMDYWPNVDAVLWFSETILPNLRTKFPDATFYIVGGKPSAAVRALGLRPGIVVVGQVPDVRPYVGNADVVVAPLRIGRGIQNKVLEGMAMARPVIVTPQALEGIDALPDTHVLVASDSAGYVRDVERIIDPVFAKSVGTAARKRVLERYNWADSLAKYDRLLEVTPREAIE